jgi:hypothetical protein
MIGTFPPLAVYRGDAVNNPPEATRSRISRQFPSTDNQEIGITKRKGGPLANYMKI